MPQIALAAARAVHAIHGPELPYFALERGKTTPVITQILTGGLIEESLETQLPARFSLVPVQDRILNPTGAVFRGVLCSDRFSAYLKYHSGKAQFCWAHLKRNLRGSCGVHQEQRRGAILP